MKINRLLRSLGVVVAGLAMLSASSLPALAYSNTQVSGTITNEYGYKFGGALVTVDCAHGNQWYKKEVYSDSYGKYYVGFDINQCYLNDFVWVSAIMPDNHYLRGVSSGRISNINNSYYNTTYPGAIINVLFPRYPCTPATCR